MNFSIRNIDWVKLLAMVIICQLAGVVGSFFTLQSIDSWYTTLNKPFFSPPNWVFGPVWVILYTLMGISAYIIWHKGLENRKTGLAFRVFGTQLVLNALWPVIFFGFKSPSIAFFELVLLLASIVVTIFLFKRISRSAAMLLIPYLIWTLFAAVLNLFIWMLNS